MFGYNFQWVHLTVCVGDVLSREVLKYKKDAKLADKISRLSVHSTKKKLYRISRKMIGTQVFLTRCSHNVLFTSNS